MKRLFLLLAISLVTSCSGGGGGGSTPSTNSEPTASISGVVSAPAGTLALLKSESFAAKFTNFLIPLAAADITGVAPVASTTVELIEVDNDGIQIGVPLFSTMTDTNGMFIMEIEVTPSPFLQLRVGSGNSQMRAFVTDEITNINPATEYVVDNVTAEITAVDQVNLSLFELDEIQEMLDLINSENIDLSSVMTVNDAKAQIEMTVGSSIDASIAIAANQLTGEWTLRAVTLESSCGDAVNIVYQVDALDIEQIGDSVIFYYDGGVTTEATLSGDQFTNVSLTSYPDDTGTTTETALSLSFGNQINQIIGDQSWDWSSPSFPSCSGRSQLFFTSADTPSMLEGSWTGDCYPLDIGSPASTMFMETYSGRHYNFSAQGFNNDTCTGSPLVTKSGTGYIYFGNEVSTNGGTITAIEMEIEIVTTTMEGQAGAIADNIGGFTTGQVLYDLAYLDGNQLYYGDWATGDTSTPGNRPTDIYLDFFMTRQP